MALRGRTCSPSFGPPTDGTRTTTHGLTAHGLTAHGTRHQPLSVAPSSATAGTGQMPAVRR
jgi:hypothetical protein